MTVNTNFKVAMCTGGVAGGAHCGDNIALIYILTYLYIKIAVMCIKRLDTVAVVDDDVVAIAGPAPFCFYNRTGGRGVYVASIAAACNIHTGMTGIPPNTAAYISADGRPDKSAASAAGFTRPAFVPIVTSLGTGSVITSVART